jgi:putative SOS response-associated peptidase YedK
VCGRYIIRQQQAAERYWKTHGLPKWPESFNVSPKATVPVIRRTGAGRAAFESAAYGQAAPNECVLLRWGLVPFWSRGIPPRYSTFNARVERIDTAAAFRGAWVRGQRCILPAAAFYEWQQRGTRRQPYLVKLADREFFGFAGLWDRSAGNDGVIESCTIITLPANPLLAKIHNTRKRMPVILREEDHCAWLQGAVEEARAVLGPYPEDLMVAWPVGLRVNSTKHDDESLMAPLAAAV